MIFLKRFAFVHESPLVLINEGQVAFNAELADGQDGVFLFTLGHFLLDEVNRDGVINLLDVPLFVDATSTGTFIAEANVNPAALIYLS